MDQTRLSYLLSSLPTRTRTIAVTLSIEDLTVDVANLCSLQSCASLCSHVMIQSETLNVFLRKSVNGIRVSQLFSVFEDGFDSATVMHSHRFHWLDGLLWMRAWMNAYIQLANLKSYLRQHNHMSGFRFCSSQSTYFIILFMYLSIVYAECTTVDTPLVRCVKDTLKCMKKACRRRGGLADFDSDIIELMQTVLLSSFIRRTGSSFTSCTWYPDLC